MHAAPKRNLQGDNARTWLAGAAALLGGAEVTTLCIWDVEQRRANKIRIRAAELARQPRQKIH